MRIILLISFFLSSSVFATSYSSHSRRVIKHEKDYRKPIRSHRRYYYDYPQRRQSTYLSHYKRRLRQKRLDRLRDNRYYCPTRSRSRRTRISSRRIYSEPNWNFRVGYSW